MAYLVLARKYRPKQFNELAGQSHVANTLLSAFKQEKLGQAYLFTGTRGVGKTSAARIFAKAIRCEQPSAPGCPCEKCRACLDINGGASLDVLEIDGASNNGVDNVREIRENVKFLPSFGKFKVYIIDEVHMLTGAAFNALLKTLEEPPAHVVFILATTEVQKIPPTILSRCQRYDFRRVPQPVIFDYLQQIAGKEKIKYEAAALRLVARKAEGSIRDSLSLLDQVIALSGDNITQARAVEILGVVDGAFLAQLLENLFNDRTIEALQSLDQAFLSGIEMKQLILDLAESLRNALLIKLDATSSLVELTEDEKNLLAKAVSNISLEVIQAAFRLCSQSLEEISRSPMPRASTEMLLVRISKLGSLLSIEQILSKGIPSNTHPQSTANTTSVMRENSSTPKPARESQNPSTASVPSYSGDITWEAFVQYVLNERPNLGAILEHAVATKPISTWKQSNAACIGFSTENSFYLEQMRTKPMQSALLPMIERFFQSPMQLRLEEVKGEIKNTSGNNKSLAESKANEEKKSSDNIKAKFLDQEIVKNAQEIFGAKLASFDINNKQK